MRFLVIGGTGLIGLATVQRLISLGHEVILVARKRPSTPVAGVRSLECDILDRDRLHAIVREAAPNAILHLAAFLQFACDRDPAMATRVNVDGTLNILELARMNGVPRVVFGSSIAVYGQTEALMREDTWQFQSTGLYGVTKLMGESLGARYQAEFAVKFLALRYSGVFGPEGSDERAASPGMSLVRKQILQCARGKDVVIEGATGQERIHLTHVSDAAEATCLALLHPHPSYTVYNVAGPRENYVSLMDLHAAVTTLAPLAGRPIWTGSGRNAGPVDTSRIQRDLGFIPATRLVDGLRQTMRAIGF